MHGSSTGAIDSTSYERRSVTGIHLRVVASIMAIIDHRQTNTQTHICIFSTHKLVFTHWGLTAPSAQIGYRAFDKYVAVIKVKLMRKLTMLCVGIHTINHYNK